MNYEQKYNEALEWMRSIYPTMQGADKEDAEHHFPELCELEDERIRKAIICGMNALKEQHKETFASIPINDCIAWLEKQGEQNTIVNESPSKEMILAVWELGDIWKELTKGSSCTEYGTQLQYIQKHWNESVYYEKLQGKQKPIEQDTETHDLWVYIREWNDKFGRLPKDEDELATCIDYVIKRQKLAEWSEEDEEMYKEVLMDIIYAKNDLKTKGCFGLSKRAMKAFNWFSKRHKSLRPQSKWKPSEEQLKALKNAIIGKRGPLYDLYFDLKKL